MALPVIALVVPSLGHGGGVRAVARFLRDTALRSTRFQVRLVSLSTSAKDEDSMLLASPASWLRGARTSTGTWEGFSFVHVGAVGGELELQRYRPRRPLARALADCDLIQVVCGSPAWANAVIGLGKPVALHVATRARVERTRRDASPRGFAARWRKAMTEVTDRMDDQALRRADAIQVMNPWMLDYAEKINSGRNVEVVYAPPGVDASVFKPLACRDLARDPYILCVARLNDPRKNLDLLLDAYAGLSQDVKASVRLVLAGQSNAPTSFWERVEAHGLVGRVTYESRPDLTALVSLYQHASVFALPSEEEGFGMVLIEAMACGIPVVSTRSGGPDAIITNGKDGYLVPLADATQMGECLHRLLKDRELNEEMGRMARRTVETRFAEEVAGEFFIGSWDKLLTK